MPVDPIPILTGIYSSVKRLYEISQKIKNAEAQNLVADLYLKMVDLKTEVVKLKEENLSLSQQLQTARQQTQPQDKLDVREGKYYLRSPAANEYPGPFCVACRSRRGQLVPLSEEAIFADIARWTCPACNATYP